MAWPCVLFSDLAACLGSGIARQQIRATGYTPKQSHQRKDQTVGLLDFPGVEIKLEEIIDQIWKLYNGLKTTKVCLIYSCREQRKSRNSQAALGNAALLRMRPTLNDFGDFFFHLLFIFTRGAACLSKTIYLLWTIFSYIFCSSF